jgi:hypothetical protein
MRRAKMRWWLRLLKMEMIAEMTEITVHDRLVGKGTVLRRRTVTHI